jgi:hypothetical protein
MLRPPPDGPVGPRRSLTNSPGESKGLAKSQITSSTHPSGVGAIH